MFLFEEKIMFCSWDIEIFLFLWNPQISKSVTSSKALLHNGSSTFAYFLWILSTIKMKHGRILVCVMVKISIMFLAQWWRLETRSRFFYVFIIMTMQQDLTIFNSWNLPFLIVLHLLFEKMKRWNPIGYWVIRAGYQIEKDLEPSPSPPNFSKDSWKLFSIFISLN